MATVGLVSCVSKKRAFATEARDLYGSPLFTKARRYVEERSESWYILSAKYGLVAPDLVIQPYEETLNSKSIAERKEWAERVWRELHPRLRHGDRVLILAGKRYREFLVRHIKQHGCEVEVPMEGLGIGRQLQWLSRKLEEPRRERDLERLYGLLRRLEHGVGGKRPMSACSGQQDWPRRGVYLFFEPGECRSGTRTQRVVRVGTHAVSQGSKATLWNRLRTHRGTGSGLGNHRSSIFRLHVGAALGARYADLAVSSWGAGQSAGPQVRKKEERLEREVSEHIGTMSLLWLAVEDEAGPASDRAYLERNLIGLLADQAGPADPRSPGWLGLHSPDEQIRRSGLWNLDFLDYPYSSKFLDIFDEYVHIAVGKEPQPQRSISPRNWHENERRGVPRSQLILFPEQ